MGQRSREDEALVAKSAALIISRLDDKLAEITHSIQELLFTELSEVGGDGELLGLLYDAVQGNLDAFFPAVRHGISIDNVEPPTAALEHARRLAQRGVDADSLVRGYRLGHQAVVRTVLDEIRAAQLETRLGLDVFEQITSTSFRYIDRISRLVLTAYQNERDRWLANQSRLRALRVREVLAGGDIDIDEMTNVIRYPLHRNHLALIVWCGESEEGNELVVMERFVTDLAKSLGADERPLFVAADRVTGWAWVPLTTEAAAVAAARIREFVNARADAPWIAAGDPVAGVDGFRRSHRQAQVVRAVVLASGSQPPTVTVVSDPGLVVAAHFSADLEDTRAWVGDVLGPLASATDSDERMRETLREFLHTGSSFKATADELHLHVNSVKYRVQRAIERRGRPIAGDRLDVEVALLLCHWFDTAVLNQGIV
ncbi:MAG TPA: helix-turn-helix domain-containing protein [Mycobacterium sp.]|jgi:DNA-binding PucR family transcriptional regulator|nr:helix-turn-helix domain-containing protein [Mycobacterium sp.]